MKSFVSFGIAALLLSSGALAQSPYYYYPKGTIPLRIDSSRVAIKFEAALTPFVKSAFIESIGRIEAVVNDSSALDDFDVCSLSTGIGYESFLDSLDTLPGIYLVEPYYLTLDGDPFPVGAAFYAAFDKAVPVQEIDSINRAFKVKPIHTLYGMPNVYELENTDSTGMRVLDLANAYHNLDATIFAHPAFGVRPVLFGYKLYDYYHQYQPHLKKIIGDFNNTTVWDFSGLDSVATVAIIDDGVTGHEDLPAERILPGYDFYDYDIDPRPGLWRAHGMACAGIVGAEHTVDSTAGSLTSSGVISLNPHVRILPVKLFSDAGWGPLEEDQVAQAITYAYLSGADILSCSWGYKVRPVDFWVIDYALEDAFNFGRNGLGCPTIFASGNFGYDSVAYPAKLEPCLAVGAVDLQDNRWDYSQYGSQLDLVAPSGETDFQGDVWSLDQMGDSGFNPFYGHITWDCPTAETNDVNYDCRFGGTSAACPMVSGVASLLLAKRPHLRVDLIYDILRNSAVTNLESGAITPPDDEYGYGRVDAFRALLTVSHGDASNDAAVDIGDAVYIVNYIFKDGPRPRPHIGTGDANCDGTVNLGDVTYIVNYIYRNGPQPPLCFKYNY